MFFISKEVRGGESEMKMTCDKCEFTEEYYEFKYLSKAG